jgi:ribosomal protein L30E
VKKRYVCGLREVLRSVERKKAKCVIVTPNIERISSPEGGLFEAVESIVRTSQQNRITVIFAMTRTSLGKAISKRLKVAALAILDPSGTQTSTARREMCPRVFADVVLVAYAGAEDHYKQALTLAHKGRGEYRRMHKRRSQQHLPTRPLAQPASVSPNGHRNHQQQQDLAEQLPGLILRAIEERARTELSDNTAQE